MPIQFGNNDAFPGIHEYVDDPGPDGAAWTTSPTSSSGSQGDDLSFDTPENLQAATTLQDWAEKGYFTPGFGGGGYDDAVADFAKGEGVFMITGNWIVANLGADNRGLRLLRDAADRRRAIRRSRRVGPASRCRSRPGSQHPDAAAAYIDWMTSDHASELLLPRPGRSRCSIGATRRRSQPGTVLADVVDAAATVSEANGVVPYLDWATPTFYDTTSPRRSRS